MEKLNLRIVEREESQLKNTQNILTKSWQKVSLTSSKEEYVYIGTRILQYTKSLGAKIKALKT